MNTHIHTYVCMYHIIHPYALLSSRPDLLLLFLALVFLPLFFLNNNNVKSYLLSRRSLEPAVGGRSSVRGQADRISWKELERYANICRANVNDELSMPWTSTYVHTYVCMNVCMDTQCVHYTHMHIQKCFLALPSSPCSTPHGLHGCLLIAIIASTAP